MREGRWGEEGVGWDGISGREGDWQESRRHIWAFELKIHQPEFIAIIVRRRSHISSIALVEFYFSLTRLHQERPTLPPPKYPFG